MAFLFSNCYNNTLFKLGGFMNFNDVILTIFSIKTLLFSGFIIFVLAIISICFSSIHATRKGKNHITNDNIDMPF